MRIYELAHDLLLRFVHMESQASTDLRSGAATDYGKLKIEAETIQEKNKQIELDNSKLKEGEPPTLLLPFKFKHKLVLMAEHWLTRYIFAALFVIMVPVVKRYFNGEGEEDEEGRDDPKKDFEDFQAYKRYKQSMN